MLTPLALEDARRLVAAYVEHYNHVRLHSAIGYVTPQAKLDGRDQEIFSQRDRKLAEARARRQQQRQAAHDHPSPPVTPARPVLDFAAIRAVVTIAAVLELLGCPPPAGRGAQQRGPCPLHGSTSATSRSFSVNGEANTFQCFKCGKSGNALDLWATATRQSSYDAALDLCQRLGRPVPKLPPPTPSPGNREEEPVVPAFETCTIT